MGDPFDFAALKHRSAAKDKTAYVLVGAGFIPAPRGPWVLHGISIDFRVDGGIGVNPMPTNSGVPFVFPFVTVAQRRGSALKDEAHKNASGVRVRGRFRIRSSGRCDFAMEF